jgi:hypothetical protein
LDKEAINLQAAFDQMKARVAGEKTDDPGAAAPKPKRAGPVIGSGPSKPIVENPDLGGGGVGANQSASVPESTAKPSPGKPASAKAVNRTAQQRREEAIAELAGQLKPDITGAKEPLRAAMPLIALEVIAPGSAGSNLDAVARAITPDQRRSVTAVQALMKGFATNPNLTTGDPAAVARMLREKADEVGGPVSGTEQGLSLGAVELCQRVDGFGRLTPLGTNTFIAGRPAAMILYTEVENFTQSRGPEPSSGDGERWFVELGQTVKLYLDSDGSEQLVMPESIVRDVSFSKRRDFFLVQRIDLPRNLSVGNYNLKLGIRDVSSGGVAERTIPIQVVADPSAVRENGLGRWSSGQPEKGRDGPKLPGGGK